MEISSIELSTEARDVLSRPFGGLCSIEEIVEWASREGRKLVSVGDAVLLSTLDLGIVPFVAVYDFKTLRRDISEEEKEKICRVFSSYEKVDNPRGHFNPESLKIAKNLMANGGALFVEGEEDSVGLAFMYHATREHLIYYGIKDKGVVAVPGEQATHIADYVLKIIGINPALLRPQ